MANNKNSNLQNKFLILLFLITDILCFVLLKIKNFVNKSALKIRDLDLGKYPLLLAPMEDVTDPSFRMICKKFGASVVYTEFISSDGLIRDGKSSVKKLEISDEERPVGIQLYGHQIDAMVEGVKIAESVKPELIDINYGCPVRKISNRGAGAGMLKNVPLMIEMTNAIVKASTLPVTVKTRLGWDEENKNIKEVALMLQDAGIEALTIHGRTRSQLYKGKADWTLIGEVKNDPAIKIPIIGNGDINSPQLALEMFEKYNVDGIMIGRAAVGRPWIFRDIKTFLESGIIPEEPLLEEKVDIALEHFQKSLEWKGERRGIFEMRRHFGNYFKALPDFKELRLKLLTSVSIQEIIEILELIRERYKGHRFISPGEYF